MIRVSGILSLNSAFIFKSSLFSFSFLLFLLALSGLGMLDNQYACLVILHLCIQLPNWRFNFLLLSLHKENLVSLLGNYGSSSIKIQLNTSSTHCFQSLLCSHCYPFVVEAGCLHKIVILNLGIIGLRLFLGIAYPVYDLVVFLLAACEVLIYAVEKYE